ncbi:AFG1 family ATPase [Lysobacter pythonis]|uniref:AFG1 family ATPase n=1 Tax=Solilutibacter pythonis TaxID=2483112 RepID=A0A3M2I5R2_9GAMM|nr:cell division protein ZapE [Lysobacter pythonis]RMH93797.1 AFG1 family ATPase [Lysobacter pythonis]
MNPAPGTAYAAGVERGDWRDDPAQRAAMAELDRLHAALSAPAEPPGLLGRLLGRHAPPPPRGLYLWGGVGRGKTFMVDLFFDSLDFPEKRRAHFHRFMRDMHARLKAHAGERDPLAAIAREWRRDMRVLVLDEFFVTDIGDAMLLGRLLERLFAEGVVLVTTSNTAPANLYKDGLQRARFLPAIALIQQHCVVMEIESSTDYRLRELTRSPVYFSPAGAAADAWLQQRWQTLTHAPARPGALDIDGRAIPVRARHHGFVWFDFGALCEGPRAAADYIEIASEFHTVLLGGIPRFEGANDDAARRFVTAIDEFYDRHVNLIAAADAAPVDLYHGERLAHAFERTASRLIEMQSAEYLAREHLT